MPMPMLTREIALILALFLILCSCAPKTMPALRQAPSASMHVLVDRPYMEVYRTVLERSRACHPMSFLTGNVRVENDLYPDIQRGEIRAVAHNGFTVMTLLGIDIMALADDRTAVTAYSGNMTWNPEMRAVERWVMHGSSECR